jgi:crotonobetainyl-CoA:carnitine CoA-transferase CaiB-like acyl-CoA transferase
VADISTGIYAAYAVAAALTSASARARAEDRHRDARRGGLAAVDVASGARRRQGLRAFAAATRHRAYQAFKARDGYFIVACLTNAFWKRLPEAIGHPSCCGTRASPACATASRTRPADRDPDGIFATRTSRPGSAHRGADIPTCKVNTVKSVRAAAERGQRDPGARAAPDARQIEILNTPVRMQGSPGR